MRICILTVFLVLKIQHSVSLITVTLRGHNVQAALQGCCGFQVGTVSVGTTLGMAGWCLLGLIGDKLCLGCQSAQASCCSECQWEVKPSGLLGLVGTWRTFVLNTMLGESCLQMPFINWKKFSSVSSMLKIFIGNGYGFWQLFLYLLRWSLFLFLSLIVIN